MMAGMPGRALAVLAALGGLVTLGMPSAVLAHVTATPSFLPGESTASISFSGPNERDVPMTAFSLSVPRGLVIRHAHEVEGWSETTDGATATWSGGSAAPEAEVAFGLTIAAEAEPTVVEVIAVQRYVDAAVVRWTVPITVTPAEETPSQNLALAGVVGLVGALLLVAIALAWRRREARALQER
jgi:uncharacterized protein YcnI